MKISGGHTMANSLKERLVDRLIKGKVITEEQLNNALTIQKKRGGKISDILVDEKYVSREELVAIIGQELGTPPIRLSRYNIDPSVLQLLPAKIVRQYRIIPISKIGNVLTVAMADPLNILAIDDIKALTGCKIGTLITTDREIEDAINEYYEASAKDAIEGLIKGLKKSEIKTIDIPVPGAQDSEALSKMINEAPVVKITDILLGEAVRLKASDILIEPQEKTVRVRYRIDGILKSAQTPPKSLQEAIVSRLKVMAGLNIAERRLPQDGRFIAKVMNKKVDFRLSVLPGNFGEKAALRILDKTTAMLDVEKLGFEQPPLEVLKKAAERPHGMMLVCGPTGSGKTTTLYSALKYIDGPEKNIVTVEDPVEYQLRGINQVSIRPSVGLTFKSSLRSILRQDPDVIMVGEIRDYDTVDIAIKAALTGHLVISTLHTTTASGSIVRLLNMGVEPFLISSSVILVLAQRLVRKICEDCKESYRIDAGIAKKLGIDPGKHKLYRGAGCKRCLDTGYKGRVGLAETLPMTARIRELVTGGAREFQIKDAARREGMSTLRENGIAKALKGVTTIEEILRVTIGDQDIVTK